MGGAREVLTEAERVLAVLEGPNPPALVKRIAEAAGIPRPRAEAVLRLLRVDGKAYATDKGSWYAGSGPSDAAA